MNETINESSPLLENISETRNEMFVEAINTNQCGSDPGPDQVHTVSSTSTEPEIIYDSNANQILESDTAEIVTVSDSDNENDVFETAREPMGQSVPDDWIETRPQTGNSQLL